MLCNSVFVALFVRASSQKREGACGSKLVGEGSLVQLSFLFCFVLFCFVFVFVFLSFRVISFGKLL